MPTVVVSPLVADADASSSKVVELQITVDLKDFEGLFNRLEVWRSVSGTAGPFEEITDATWRGARIPRTAGDEPASSPTGESVTLVGKELKLRLNENEDDDLTITFTGVDPLTFAEAASQVVAQGLGKVKAYVSVDGAFVLQTTQPGTGTSLRVLESDGATILGLPTTDPDAYATGKESRVALVSGQSDYDFKDFRGSATNYYRTRFRNSLDHTTSEFSRVFGAGAAAGLLPDHLAVGRLELIGLNGSPLKNERVTVYNAFQSSLIDGRLITESRQSKTSDENGVVEFTLIRGARVTVAISNTSVVRDIIVPAEGATFNLLNPDVGAGDDVFKVQVPELVYAERRSL